MQNRTKAQFCDRAASYSTHGSRRGVNLLGWEVPQNISDDQKYEILNGRLHYLEKTYAETPKQNAFRKKRVWLKHQIRETKRLIHEVSPRHVRKSLAEYTCDVIRSDVSGAQWRKWQIHALKKKISKDSSRNRDTSEDKALLREMINSAEFADVSEYDLIASPSQGGE